MLNETPVEYGIMPEVQQRRCNAALEIMGLTKKDYAEQEGLGYWRVSKMMRGAEPVTATYIGPFNDLLNRAQEVLETETQPA